MSMAIVIAMKIMLILPMPKTNIIVSSLLLLLSGCLTPSMVSSVGGVFDGDDILYSHISSLTDYKGQVFATNTPTGVYLYKQGLIKEISSDRQDFLIKRSGDGATFWVEYDMFNSRDKKFIIKLLKQIDKENFDVSKY